MQTDSPALDQTSVQPIGPAVDDAGLVPAAPVQPNGLAAAKVTSSEAIPLGDDLYLRSTVYLTIGVLLYPIVFSVSVAFVIFLNIFLNEEEPFTFFPGVIYLFAGLAAAFLLYNMYYFSYSVQKHLQKVREDVRKAIERIKGVASHGGPEEVEKVDGALARFERLLSWRYFFTYVGYVTAGFYLFFFALFLVALILALVDEYVFPLSLRGYPSLRGYFVPLALFILMYYVLAFFLRRGLRGTLGEYLRVNE